MAKKMTVAAKDTSNKHSVLSQRKTDRKRIKDVLR